MGAIASALTGPQDPTSVLQQQQAQFEANFVLQTHQAMIDNQNQTMTSIAQSHAQAAAASTAGEAQLGQANAKIVA